MKLLHKILQYNKNYKVRNWDKDLINPSKSESWLADPPSRFFLIHQDENSVSSFPIFWGRSPKSPKNSLANASHTISDSVLWFQVALLIQYIDCKNSSLWKVDRVRDLAACCLSVSLWEGSLERNGGLFKATPEEDKGLSSCLDSSVPSKTYF